MFRKITSVFIAILLLLPVALQVEHLNAGVASAAPITAPVSFFNLVGHVTYKKLGAFISGPRVSDAANVIIKVVNFFDDNQKYDATTDMSGNYMLNVPAGLWKIEAQDNADTFFVPPFTVKKLTTNKVKHANFQGLKFQ